MEINKLIKKINNDYPEIIAMDFDNTGLNIGDDSEKITGIIVCLDVDMGAIDLAIKNNANLILSHHPITFNSYKNITKDINSKRIRKIIRNGINCYSMHTNFDLNIEKGMTKLVLDKFTFKNIKNKYYFDEIKYNNKKYGIGIGFSLTKKIDIYNLYKEAIKSFNLDMNRTALYKFNDSVKNIAIAPGSGRSEVKEVIEKKYDLFITSDLSHNDILDLKDSGISYINLTHYGIEKVFVDYMEKYINKFDKKLKVYKYYSNM